MPPSDSPISRLSQYYLECLSLDDDSGVSLFAQSKFTPDYVEVPALLTEEGHVPFDDQGQTKNFLQQLQKDATRKVPCIGYPVRLRQHTSKKGYTFFFVEPVLLFPIERDENDPGAPFRLSNEPPTINTAILKNLAQGSQESVMVEAATLADELHLWEKILPSSEEIIRKLVELRPQWDWAETIDPHSLSEGPALSTIQTTGIYNRAIIYGAEQSKFTKGLESELRKLMSTSPEQLSGTALGHWLEEQEETSEATAPDPDEKPLLEPIPLNLEQRQAIRSALSKKLSVVTGPPGTGKSQIVSALLMNAAIRGKKVLFASKNNKAVDVVESRVNSLGPRPLLLRLGKNEHQSQLAEYLASLLGSQVTQEDVDNYDEAVVNSKTLVQEAKRLQGDLVRLIEIRNAVDRDEQASEAARETLGEPLFAKTADMGFLEDLKKEAGTLSPLLYRASKSKQTGLTKMLWLFLGRSRIQSFNQCLESCREIKQDFGLECPPPASSEEGISAWQDYHSKLLCHIDHLTLAHDYHEKRKLLSMASPLEEFYKAIAVNNENVAQSSISFWEAWLKLVPSRLSKDDRKNLGNYLSVLQMMVKANQSQTSAGRQVRNQLHELYPKVAKILSCWAVTSLSASGKIPFEPGFYDLVVIDEASQCDIASAIPLLYRAKAAVIIGDPKQLQHISTIAPNRNTNLMARHDLIADHARWNYSDQSVFALASSIVGPGGVTMLLDHHRSHADIIGFSNHHFYEKRLRVATQYDKLSRPPGNEAPVRWIDVRGETSLPTNGSGAQNRAEAKAVIQELERLVISQSYKGTVGIVTPFRAQASLLQRLITNHPHSAVLMHKTQLLCDTAHRFQGDERDVILFSPVVAAGMSSGATNFLKHTGNLFNVAITRARASLVVVGDAAAAAHSDIDYLCKFVTYAQQTTHDTRDESDRKKPPMTKNFPPVSNPGQVSDWERGFYEKLHQSGIHTVPQYRVEKYSLDLALFDGKRQLDIEVDGERYHKAWNGELLYRDQLRNMRMIELGWDIMRFWVYELRDDPDGCIERVRQWLDNK